MTSENMMLVADHEAEIARLTAAIASAEAYAAADRRIAQKTAADAVMWKARAEKAEAERDAALAGAVKVKHDRLAFGLGNLCVDTGDYDGIPAVFVAPARFPGEVGSPAKREGHPLDALVPDEMVLTFPTLDQAKRVADALCNVKPDPDAPQADLAKAWQPIETAPRGVEVGGNNAVSWMVLAWPDGEGGYHRQSGMMVGEKFYAAPAFYIGGRRGGKHYELREIEIFPTHWMPDPPAPADMAARIGGE